MRSAVVAVVLVALLSVPAFSAPPDSGAVGAWTKVPATDPAVKKATAYLLKVINSGSTPFLTDRNGTVSITSTTSTSTQVVAGLNVKATVAFKDQGGRVAKVQFIVWQRAKGTFAKPVAANEITYYKKLESWS